MHSLCVLHRIKRDDLVPRLLKLCLLKRIRGMETGDAQLILGERFEVILTVRIAATRFAGYAMACMNIASPNQ